MLLICVLSHSVLEMFFFSSLRPFERTITMQKDSNGYIGFVFKDGRIKSLVKDSSAARNGLLTDHQLIEIGGQNCVGLKVSHFKVTLLHSPRSKFTILFQVNFCITRLVKNLRRDYDCFFFNEDLYAHQIHVWMMVMFVCEQRQSGLLWSFS